MRLFTVAAWLNPRVGLALEGECHEEVIAGSIAACERECGASADERAHF